MSENGKRLTVIFENGMYFLEDGTRLFTRKEVKTCIDGATIDGSNGYEPGDNLISDYIDDRNRRKA